MLDVLVDHELDQCALQAYQGAGHGDETRSRQLRRAFEIHATERLAEIDVVARHEIELRGFAPAPELLIVFVTVAVRDRVVEQIWQAEFNVLQSRLNVDRPSEVQVQTLRDQIGNIDNLIADLRTQLTRGTDDQASIAQQNTELRTAEENYNFQTMMVQQALTQMETARIEANRQVRYLSQSVRPVIPDEATYPKAFENTLLAFFIFSGIYLMISLTASVLREQVSS